MPKPTRTSRKIANTFMTVASGEINSVLETYKVIYHVAKVKAARSAYSMADVIPFFQVFNIPFEANASIKPKNILSTHYVTFSVYQHFNSFFQTRPILVECLFPDL